MDSRRAIAMARGRRKMRKERESGDRRWFRGTAGRVPPDERGPPPPSPPRTPRPARHRQADPCAPPAAVSPPPTRGGALRGPRSPRCSGTASRCFSRLTLTSSRPSRGTASSCRTQGPDRPAQGRMCQECVRRLTPYSHGLRVAASLSRHVCWMRDGGSDRSDRLALLAPKPARDLADSPPAAGGYRRAVRCCVWVLVNHA